MSTRGSSASGPLASIGERGLIKYIREQFPAAPGVLHVGIGDDAAVVPPLRGELQVLTTDALVEGVHFDLRLSSFFDVGYKALAVNVSDVASMGGTPHLALLSLVLPDRLTIADVQALLDGFRAMAAEARVVLAGGNITSSPGPLVVDVTATGTVRPRRILTRGGGRPGDVLYVSGSVGDAAAGLGYLKAGGTGDSDDDPFVALAARHRRPTPRVRLGRLLGRSRAATACMDLSDGLADGVTQLATASGTGALIHAAALPVSAAARQWYEKNGHDPVRTALAGGDDYELLFAVAPKLQGRLRTVRQQAQGVPLTRIGELTAAPAILLERDGGTEPLPDGFTHF